MTALACQPAARLRVLGARRVAWSGGHKRVPPVGGGRFGSWRVWPFRGAYGVLLVEARLRSSGVKAPCFAVARNWAQPQP